MLRPKPIQELRREAKQFKVPGKYQNLSRHDLQRILAATKIQRMWRRLRPRNLNDPFTLEPFTANLRFFHIEDPENIWQFEPVSLYDYFFKSGQFCNPYTRKPFLLPELRRLDKLLAKTGRPFVSLAQNSRTIFRERRQMQEHALTVEFLYQEAIAGMQCIWEPRILTMENFVAVVDQLYDVCQRIVPVFLAQINDLRQREWHMAKACVEIVLYHLREVNQNIPSFLGPTLYSMAQRNAAATAHFLISDYYEFTFRGSTPR